MSANNEKPLSKKAQQIKREWEIFQFQRFCEKKGYKNIHKGHLIEAMHEEELCKMNYAENIHTCDIKQFRAAKWSYLNLCLQTECRVNKFRQICEEKGYELETIQLIEASDENELEKMLTNEDVSKKELEKMQNATPQEVWEALQKELGIEEIPKRGNKEPPET